MFGMGFTEILLIAVVAIIFVGPDKLPSMLIDIAKFFRSVKSTIGTVKETIKDEVDMTDIKREALAYKQELQNATEDLNDDILSMDDEKPKTPKADTEPKEVTFKKKKKNKEEKTDV